MCMIFTQMVDRAALLMSSAHPASTNICLLYNLETKNKCWRIGSEWKKEDVISYRNICGVPEASTDLYLLKNTSRFQNILLILGIQAIVPAGVVLIIQLV